MNSANGVTNGANDDKNGDTNSANGTNEEIVIKKKILLLMKKDSRITQVKLSEQLNVSKRTISRYVKELVQSNIIVRIGNNRSGEWLVNEDDRKYVKK